MNQRRYNLGAGSRSPPELLRVKSSKKNYNFLVAQTIETLFFDNSVKPGQMRFNLLIE